MSEISLGVRGQRMLAQAERLPEIIDERESGASSGLTPAPRPPRGQRSKAAASLSLRLRGRAKPATSLSRDVAKPEVLPLGLHFEALDEIYVLCSQLHT